MGTGWDLNCVPITKTATLTLGVTLKEGLLDAEQPPSLIRCL